MQKIKDCQLLASAADQVQKTAQKVVQPPEISTFSTPTSTLNIYFGHADQIKKKKVKPVTLKMVHLQVVRLLEQGTKGQKEIVVYQLVGRINAITASSNTYSVSFTDDTTKSVPFQMLFPKHQPQNIRTFLSNAQNNEQHISEIQFQPSLQEGQPYFRVWVKIVIEDNEGNRVGKLMIERIERVVEIELLTYHSAKVMEGVLREERLKVKKEEGRGEENMSRLTSKGLRREHM